MESDVVSDSTNFNAVDLTSLTSPVVNDTKFRGVDILITSQWPKGVEKYGTALVRETNFLSIFFYQPQRLLTVNEQNITKVLTIRQCIFVTMFLKQLFSCKLN